MTEQKRYSLKRRIAIGAGIVGGLAVCAAGSYGLSQLEVPPAPPTSTPEPTPSPTPELYSKDTDSYEYRITMDAGRYNEIFCYTNTEPNLDASGAMAILDAERIYCEPGSKSGFMEVGADREMDRFGLDTEYKEIYHIASPARIVYASQGISTPTSTANS